MGRLVPVILGLVGGLLGAASPVPAGALLGAIAAVAAYNLSSSRPAPVPGFLRLPSRALAGAVIGALVTPALLGVLARSLGWAIAATLAVVVLGLGLGLLLARLARLDRRTGLLACCPGGIAEMTALASDVGARTDVVLGVHIVRKLGLIAAVALLAPWLW